MGKAGTSYRRKTMLSAACTDIGNVKKVNQDSCLIKEALTSGGTIFFAAVCDGMGGLKNGEIASAYVTEAMSEWFSHDLAVLAADGFTGSAIKKSMNTAILAADERVNRFSENTGDCGTTLSAILIINGRYLTVNVGDSRVYKIDSEDLLQLTHDQTLAQQRVDEGEIDQEDAEKDPGQSILLQCIGAGGDVVPDYTEGICEKGDVFLLCSDGFRHKLSRNEIRSMYAPEKMRSEKVMEKALRAGIDMVKKRKERDNITAVLVKKTE